MIRVAGSSRRDTTGGCQRYGYGPPHRYSPHTGRVGRSATGGVAQSDLLGGGLPRRGVTPQRFRAASVHRRQHPSHGWQQRYTRLHGLWETATPLFFAGIAARTVCDAWSSARPLSLSTCCGSATVGRSTAITGAGDRSSAPSHGWQQRYARLHGLWETATPLFLCWHSRKNSV